MTRYPTYAAPENVVMYSYFDPKGLEVQSGLMTGTEYMKFLNQLRSENTPEDCLCATIIYHVEAVLDDDGGAIVYESLSENEYPHTCDTCDRRCRAQLDACEEYICKNGENCPHWTLRMLERPRQVFCEINGKAEMILDESDPR